ncbi:MAG TPA: tetratricopeptide repeat protein [Gemmataceae bacterium]|nr:tetratricopeptide repeat protein [Gemmataceae bacterium]
MATEQAPTAAPNPLPAAAEPAEFRRLWQVPTFVMGVVSLVAVALAHPYWQAIPVNPLDHDLAKARAALDPPHADLGRAQLLAEEILRHSDLTPEQAGLAHFIAGSCYLKRAADTNLAQNWAQARAHLEKAEALGVPPADEPILTYNLARAWFQTGQANEQTIAYLLRARQANAGDPAETYGMLAQCYLRLPQPDLSSALDAVDKQLALPYDNASFLVPARLLRGELLLRLGKGSAARLALEYIKPQDPPAIYARARWLLATSYQREGLYAEAQKLWQDILRDTAHRPSDPERIRYDLGICYLQQGQRAEADSAWQIVSQATGGVAQAAAFRLAELRLHGTAPETAQEVLDDVLKQATAANYRNELMPLNEVRRICEEGCQIYIRAGKYDLSRRLALAYERWAAPGRAQELVGQALDAWAAHQREQAHGPGASRALDEARTHDHDAGAAYELAAQTLPTADARAEALWRSGDRYMSAGDFTSARAILKRYLQLPLPAERLAAGWYSLGLVYQSLHQDTEAVDAYHQCITVAGNGRFAFRARYQLAEAEIEKGRPGPAEEILVQNLHLMAFDPDPEAHERTLLALAELLFKRGDYEVAAQHLRDALEQYPTDPRAGRARLTLAACYRKLADRENDQLTKSGGLDRSAREHYEHQYREWLAKATANYQKLKADLRARAEQNLLTDADAALLRQAEFAEAECRFDLGQYDATLKLYDGLAERYAHQAAGLDALTQVTRCYWVKNQPDQALRTLDRLRAAIRAMGDEELLASSVAQTRKAWDEWLSQATALCKPAPTVPPARMSNGQ